MVADYLGNAGPIKKTEAKSAFAANDLALVLIAAGIKIPVPGKMDAICKFNMAINRIIGLLVTTQVAAVTMYKICFTEQPIHDIQLMRRQVMK